MAYEELLFLVPLPEVICLFNTYLLGPTVLGTMCWTGGPSPHYTSAVGDMGQRRPLTSPGSREGP